MPLIVSFRVYLPLIMDWLREDIRVSISTYEKYLVLWNVKLNDYMNIALRKVVEELNGMHPQIM